MVSEYRDDSLRRSFTLPPSLPESDEAESGERVIPERVIAGRYGLGKFLGRGAHGEVWEADDSLAGELCAIKLLRPGYGAPAARVRREVAALRLLRLPGVVRLLDEGVDEGRIFLVMERIDGRPFPGASTPRAWPAIAGATVALLETLARIHAAGVVHRDLKPANVLVNAEGHPTILDFGLSYGAALGDGLTESGEILGTPAYLAPEQINGGPVTARTDLYAIGVLLYAALAGRLPHDARDLMGLMRARLTVQPAPLQDFAEDIPIPVADVVGRLLAIDAKDRPRSATDVLEMLRGQPVLAPPALRRLGSQEPVRALLCAASAGRAMDLRGPPGSGRTRCLREVADALAPSARRVIWVIPGRRPFSSLLPLLGALNEYASERLSVVDDAVERRVRAILAEGSVLVADDVERIDRASAEVLRRCRGAGAILRAIACPLDSPAPEGEGVAEEVHLRPLEPSALRALFAGPDRLLHLREDAARALWIRTEGLPDRIVHEITAWVRAGIARWDGDLLVIDRAAIDWLDAGLRVTAPLPDAPPPSAALPAPLPPHLDEMLAWIAIAWPHTDVAVLAAAMGRPLWSIESEIDELLGHRMVRALADGRLEPRVPTYAEESWSWERRQAAHRSIARALRPGTPGRLLHLIAGGDEFDAAQRAEIAREAQDVARQSAREGRLGQAVVAIGEGLRAASRPTPILVEETEGLLSQWVEIALAKGTPRALDRVLYEICRAKPRTEATIHLEELVRAALAVGMWTDRALAMASAVKPFADVELERWRQGLRVTSARRASLAREEAVLAEVTAWVEASGDAHARASLADWLGRLRYRQGRFDEAAALQATAATGALWTTARISAYLNGASALLEAFRHREAAELIRTALDIARSSRHTLYETRAEWLLRAAAYRAGTALEPDRELLEAVAHAGVGEIEAFICLNEAAVAWRAGQPRAGLELAARSRRMLVHIGERWGSLLAGCLRIACGGEATAAETHALAQQAVGCPLPRVCVQALGLLALAGIRPAVLSDQEITAAIAGVPRECWRFPMEVLSLQEALEALRPDISRAAWSGIAR